VCRQSASGQGAVTTSARPPPAGSPRHDMGTQCTPPAGLPMFTPGPSADVAASLDMRQGELEEEEGGCRRLHNCAAGHSRTAPPSSPTAQHDSGTASPWRLLLTARSAAHSCPVGAGCAPSGCCCASHACVAAPSLPSGVWVLPAGEGAGAVASRRPPKRPAGTPREVRSMKKRKSLAGEGEEDALSGSPGLVLGGRSRRPAR
jgi:hypothetical protein